MSDASSGGSASDGKPFGPDGMVPGDRPILPLWLRGGVLAIVLCAIAYALTAQPQDSMPPLDQRGDLLASREMRFVDEPDGSISVLDATGTGDAEILRVAVGEDGFIRSVMRGLARQRLAEGLGPEVPFSVSAYADGQVYLNDPATGREVALNAFGPDNAAAFLRLLPRDVLERELANLEKRS